MTIEQIAAELGQPVAEVLRVFRVYGVRPVDMEPLSVFEWQFDPSVVAEARTVFVALELLDRSTQRRQPAHAAGETTSASSQTADAPTQLAFGQTWHLPTQQPTYPRMTMITAAEHADPIAEAARLMGEPLKRFTSLARRHAIEPAVVTAAEIADACQLAGKTASDFGSMATAFREREQQRADAVKVPAIEARRVELRAAVEEQNRILDLAVEAHGAACYPLQAEMRELEADLIRFSLADNKLAATCFCPRLQAEQARLRQQLAGAERALSDAAHVVHEVRNRRTPSGGDFAAANARELAAALDRAQQAEQVARQNRDAIATRLEENHRQRVAY